MMKTLLRLYQMSTHFDDALTDWGGALLLLYLRCYVGWQFFKSGLVKISDWQATLALFEQEYRVPVLPPDIAAYLSVVGELTFPALLFAGLLSRPAAAGLFLVNAMAVISYPQLFEFECPAAINNHYFWGAVLLVVIAFGAGRFSLDALVTRYASRHPKRL